VPEDMKRAAFRALEEQILAGDAKASPEQRAAAFTNTDVPAAVQELIGKVATTPEQVTDADFAAAEAAGFSEDQVFELVVAAAVGQSARLYDAGLAALAAASDSRTSGDGPVSDGEAG
jgi:alkylhydroperoxidase family enzyme